MAGCHPLRSSFLITLQQCTPLPQCRRLQSSSKALGHGVEKKTVCVVQFAKAKEAEGRYQEAVESYERAGDSGAMVRLLLNNLNNSNKAFAIARTSRHKASASMVARYCLSRSNWESAVEFLMLCGDVEEAWALAQTHAVMHAYSQALGADATPTMHSKVALYYQNAGARCPWDAVAVPIQGGTLICDLGVCATGLITAGTQTVPDGS